MDNQELNEKLAKWAGDFDFTPDGRYEAPDGEWNIEFTDSLDACFKWLVPKLKMYELHSYNQDGEHTAAVSILTDGGWRGYHATSPALALFLAIENLIDEI